MNSPNEPSGWGFFLLILLMIFVLMLVGGLASQLFDAIFNGGGTCLSNPC